MRRPLRPQAPGKLELARYQPLYCTRRCANMVAAQLPTPAQFRRDSQKTAKKYLDLVTKTATKAGVPCATLCITDDHPYTAIVKIART